MSTPEQIGRYQILERIGSGGFATVWRAHDTELQDDVAVKILAENWIERTDIQERFLEEARILRRADADGVVRVYDIGRLDDDRPYFVMSYADGGTLADRLTAGPLPADQALRYAGQTARGVSVLHDLGVIHRDIKPSNVLVRAGGHGEQLMIADLGLAKAFAHASGFTVAAGTPGYMSPEQAGVGGGLDQRSDVYSLGALTYQLLTGHKPAAPSGVQGLTPPSQARPDLPQGTDEVVYRALHQDRDSRWPNANAFAAAVDGLLAPGADATRQLPSPGVVGTPPTQPRATAAQPPWQPPTSGGGPGDPTVHTGAARRGRRRKRVTMLVAGCSALVLIVAAGLVYWQLAPETIRSADGAVEMQIPHEWADLGSRSVQVDTASDYGGYGNAVLLTTSRTNELEHGVAVVADRDLGGDTDPVSTMEINTPSDWRPYDCSEESRVADMFTPNEEFQSGSVWTYLPSCSEDPRYAQATLIGRGKKYGVRVFLAGNDTEEFTSILDSIVVDPDKLPRNDT